MNKVYLKYVLDIEKVVLGKLNQQVTTVNKYDLIEEINNTTLKYMKTYGGFHYNVLKFI